MIQTLVLVAYLVLKVVTCIVFDIQIRNMR